ncbi:hypothetical protein C8R44DRAFT_803999 [Mycena epipterygia]|nr:hypothetical protein C8R44DRAFT_803999 [Mycena epipterygia]
MQEEFWQDNNAAIKYSSGGQWARAYGSIYHGGAVMKTRRLGDSMSFRFQGSGIKFMGAQGWDHGSFVVNLDGEETVVDGYCCGSGGGVPQVIQFETSGLSNAQHVLNVTNLAAGPRGTVLEVDALITTPHPSNKYTSHLSLVMFLIILAFVLAAIRRRLIRLANKTSQQMLPLPTSGPSNPERVPSAAVAPPPHNTIRPGKGAVQAFSDGVSAAAAGGGASGSSSSQHMPPQYTPAGAAGPQVDDELVERIAQRLARLVHDDAPPTYEHVPTQPGNTV